MKILAMANNKGGVGKTTTLVNLARHLEKNGYRTVVFDFDLQGNAALSLSEYKAKYIAAHSLFDCDVDFPAEDMEKNLLVLPESNLLTAVEQLPLKESIARLKNGLSEFEKAGFDFCLIDTPPALCFRLSAALACADFVLSPIELEYYSIAGITKISTLIDNIRKTENLKLVYLGMLPSRFNTHSLLQKQNLKELAASPTFGKILMPVQVTLRSSIAYALATKKAIWEIDKRAAKKAMKELEFVNEYIISVMS